MSETPTGDPPSSRASARRFSGRLISAIETIDPSTAPYRPRTGTSSTMTSETEQTFGDRGQRQAALVAEAEQGIDERRVHVPHEHAQRAAARSGPCPAKRVSPTHQITNGAFTARTTVTIAPLSRSITCAMLRARRTGARARPRVLQLAQRRQRHLHEHLRLIREHRQQLPRARVRHDGFRTEQLADHDEVGAAEQHLRDLVDADPGARGRL